MSDFLSAYSIQSWLESCPQGYLVGTEFGHDPGDREPPIIVETPSLKDEAIRVTIQIVLGERCALAASSGLINLAPDEASKRFLATQTLDEARHVEIFTRRLYDLGVHSRDLEDLLKSRANPNLMEFASLLLEKVDKGDFVAGVVGQNIILEGMAFSVFEMMRAANENLNPKFARTLDGTIADERRHVGFGENRIGALIREHPEKKAEVQRLQRDMTYYMLATFADSFRDSAAAVEETRALDLPPESRPGTWKGANLAELTPEEMEQTLADTVLAEFKTRLGRVGIEYQTPPAP